MASHTGEGSPTWRLGLRQRVATLILLIPSAVLLVALPLLFSSQHERAEEEFLGKLRTEARVLALALSDKCDQGCLHSLEPPVDELLRLEPELLSIDIIDRQTGERMGSWGSQREGAGQSLDQDLASLRFGEHSEDVILQEEGQGAGALHGGGHRFTALTPLKTNRWPDHERAILRIRATSRVYNQRVNHLMALALLPGVLAGIVGILLAYWLHRRLRDSVGSLMQATGEIAEGRFDRRVSVRPGDELRPLGEAVNVMAHSLAEQRGRLDANAKDLEETVARRTQELEKARAIALSQERVAAMGVLAAGVAHEIGNPLTAISTIVQGLRPGEDGRLADDNLGVLSENLERIRHIVRGLVTYARPPANEWSSVSVNDVLRRTLDLLRLDPRAKDVTFRSQLDPELPAVSSVEGKLQQVFLNLFLNALDAIGPAAGELAVTTVAEEEVVRVRIDDDGPGVPEELRDKILEAFFTTRASEGGTGLGLAVSASLVEELGGRLTVGDAPLGGARFELTLPLAPEVS